MRVAVGSDHAGFALKEHVKQLLLDQGHDVADCGPTSATRVDYPDYAHAVAGKVEAGEVERGVLVCGSGIGVSIAANKHRGVRAANCTHEFHAEYARRHNDANVLCLGERVVGQGVAERLVRLFFTSPFDGGRHEGRVKKIEP